MTTDAAQQPDASEEAPQPRYITDADFREFQRRKDIEVNAERQLANEAFARVTELEERIASLQERDYADDDPRMVELRKKLDTAEKRARDAEGLVRRFSPAYKRALVESESLKLARGDEQAAEQFASMLAHGRTEDEVRAIAQEIKARGMVAVPHPRSAPEVDAGRGSGGGTPRVTKAWVESLSDEDYETHRTRILSAMKEAGGVLPER